MALTRPRHATGEFAEHALEGFKLVRTRLAVDRDVDLISVSPTPRRAGRDRHVSAPLAQPDDDLPVVGELRNEFVSGGAEHVPSCPAGVEQHQLRRGTSADHDQEVPAIT